MASNDNAKPEGEGSEEVTPAAEAEAAAKTPEEAAPAAPETVEAEPQLKALLEGVVMTEKSLSEAFARHHIEIIDPLGEKFDPNLHEAMFEVPDPQQPAGTVAQVIEVGYRLHDRLLRAARVGVFKSVPAAAEAAAPADGAAGDDGPAGPEGAAKPGQRIDTAV